MFETLVNNNNFEAASSFLSLVLFRAVNKTKGSLEQYPKLYFFIEQVIKFPLKSNLNLERVLNYVLEISKVQEKFITYNKVNNIIII